MKAVCQRCKQLSMTAWSSYSLASAESDLLVVVMGPDEDKPLCYTCAAQIFAEKIPIVVAKIKEAMMRETNYRRRAEATEKTYLIAKEEPNDQ